MLQQLNNDSALREALDGIIDKLMERGLAVKLVGGDPTIRIFFNEIDPYDDGETSIWGVIELEHEDGEDGPDSIEDEDAEELADWVSGRLSSIADDLAPELAETIEELGFVVSYQNTFYG